MHASSHPDPPISNHTHHHLTNNHTPDHPTSHPTGMDPDFRKFLAFALTFVSGNWAATSLGQFVSSFSSNPFIGMTIRALPLYLSSPSLSKGSLAMRDRQQTHTYTHPFTQFPRSCPYLPNPPPPKHPHPHQHHSPGVRRAHDHALTTPIPHPHQPPPPKKNTPSM